VKKIRDISARGFITLSISTFVPKPFTPFQWHPMENLSEIKERLKIIKKGLLQIKGVKVFHDVPKYAYMQGLFSMGDRRVLRVIEKMSKTDDWIKAGESAGINKDFTSSEKKTSAKSCHGTLSISEPVKTGYGMSIRKCFPYKRRKEPRLSRTPILLYLNH
jgi:radical SAM superfamily enzyme YgiQ (UPF0313 family)